MEVYPRIDITVKLPKSITPKVLDQQAVSSIILEGLGKIIPLRESPEIFFPTGYTVLLQYVLANPSQEITGDGKKNLKKAVSKIKFSKLPVTKGIKLTKAVYVTKVKDKRHYTNLL